MQQQLSHQKASAQLPPQSAVEQKKKRLLSDKQKEALRIGREKRWKHMLNALEKKMGAAPVPVKGNQIRTMRFNISWIQTCLLQSLWNPTLSGDHLPT